MDLEALLIEPFSARFMQRALLTAAMLGVSGALVGTVLVLRRLALVADSFGHALLPGVAIAWVLAGASLAAMGLGALAGGVFAVVVSMALSRGTRLKEDAAFGALFTILFALGAAILSSQATPTDLGHWLLGNILAITADDARLCAGALTLTLLAMAVGWRGVVLECFDRGFYRASGGASTVTHALILLVMTVNLIAALQAVGTVLSLGLFVLPAVSALLWCRSLPGVVLLAACLGPLGAVAGLLASYHLNAASGACMVLALGAVFAVSCLAGPYGIIRRRWRRRRHLAEHGAGDCAIDGHPHR